MPRPRMQFATAALVAAGLLVPLFPSLSRAQCEPAMAAPPAPDATVWALATGHPVFAPYDPVTFIGPPVPLAILFAPAVPSLSPGMRIEIEAPLTPAGPPRPAPPAEPMLRLDDVRAKLVPVRRPDGTLWIDLSGITSVDLRAVIEAGQVRLTESDTPANGGDR